MDSKSAPLIWITCLLVIGTPQLQILTVQGLECDICIRLSPSYRRDEPCKLMMPCNTAEDMTEAGQRLSSKFNEHMELLRSVYPEQSFPSAISKEFTPRFLRSDTDGYGSPVCRKEVGFVQLNRIDETTGVDSKAEPKIYYFTITYCSRRRRDNEVTPPPAPLVNEKEGGFPEWRAELHTSQVLQCDEKSEEKACRVFSATTRKLPQCGSGNGQGLECDVCVTAGKHQPPCCRIPCSTEEDIEAAVSLFKQKWNESMSGLKEEVDTTVLYNPVSGVITRYSLELSQLKRRQGAQFRPICTKQVFTYHFENLQHPVPQVISLCENLAEDPNIARKYPPRPEPYFTNPLDNDSELRTMKFMYVCEKETQDNCRVTKDDLSGRSVEQVTPPSELIRNEANGCHLGPGAWLLVLISVQSKFCLF